MIDKITTVNEDLLTRLGKILSDIHFPYYVFYTKESHGGVYLYGQYSDADIHTGDIEVQTTRKWLISPMMTESEIVFTVFKCALTSFEHRAREAFTYKSARICSPHFDVNDLVRLCKDGKADAGGRS